MAEVGAPNAAATAGLGGGGGRVKRRRATRSPANRNLPGWAPGGKSAAAAKSAKEADGHYSHLSSATSARRASSAAAASLAVAGTSASRSCLAQRSAAGTAGEEADPTVGPGCRRPRAADRTFGRSEDPNLGLRRERGRAPGVARPPVRPAALASRLLPSARRSASCTRSLNAASRCCRPSRSDWSACEGAARRARVCWAPTTHNSTRAVCIPHAAPLRICPSERRPGRCAPRTLSASAHAASSVTSTAQRQHGAQPPPLPAPLSLAYSTSSHPRPEEPPEGSCGGGAARRRGALWGGRRAALAPADTAVSLALGHRSPWARFQDTTNNGGVPAGAAAPLTTRPVPARARTSPK
jgi:hypothetical protein